MIFLGGKRRREVTYLFKDTERIREVVFCFLILCFFFKPYHATLYKPSGNLECLKCTFYQASLVSVVQLLRCLSWPGCFLYPRRSLKPKKKKKTHKRQEYVTLVPLCICINTCFQRRVPPRLYAWEKKAALETRIKSEQSCDLMSCHWQVYVHAVRKDTSNI